MLQLPLALDERWGHGEPFLLIPCNSLAPRFSAGRHDPTVDFTRIRKACLRSVVFRCLVELLPSVEVTVLRSILSKAISRMLIAALSISATGYIAVAVCCSANGQCNPPCITLTLTRVPLGSNPCAGLGGGTACSAAYPDCGECYDPCYATANTWKVPTAGGGTATCVQATAATACANVNALAAGWACVPTGSGVCNCSKTGIGLVGGCPLAIPAGATYYQTCLRKDEPSHATRNMSSIIQNLSALVAHGACASCHTPSLGGA